MGSDFDKSRDYDLAELRTIVSASARSRDYGISLG